MTDVQPVNVRSALNTVTWWEIPVAELAVAQVFYGTLFGWTYVPFGETYAGVVVGGAMIGGLVQSPDTAGAVGHRMYVNVADLEATLAAAEVAGGAVATARTEVGDDMGWWAEIVDPGGHTLGLSTMNAAI